MWGNYQELVEALAGHAVYPITRSYSKRADAAGKLMKDVHYEWHSVRTCVCGASHSEWSTLEAWTLKHAEHVLGPPPPVVIYRKLRWFDGLGWTAQQGIRWDCPRCMDTGWFGGKPSSHHDKACQECNGLPERNGVNARRNRLEGGK